MLYGVVGWLVCLVCVGLGWLVGWSVSQSVSLSI